MRWALFTLSAVGFVAVGTAVFGAVNGGISDFLQSRVAVKKDFVPYQERRNMYGSRQHTSALASLAAWW